MKPGRKLRDLFTAFDSHKDLIYLDSAATSLKPKSVVEAMGASLGKNYGTVHRSIYSLAREATSRFERSRELIADYIGAKDASELVFTRGTTDAINLVAHGIERHFSEGDEIILSVLEHHSNLVPWQLLAERKKLKLKYVNADSYGKINHSELEALIGPRTRLVALSHMPNTTGILQDFSAHFQKAKKFGAFCLLDGAQSITSSKIDVTTLGADFFAFSAHKIYGPTGLGFLWGKKQALEQLSCRDGGGEMIKEVGLYESSFAELPLRLEAGTPPIAEVLTMGAVIEFLQQFDFKSLLDHKLQLSSSIIEGLLEIEGAKVYASSGQSSLVMFSIEGVHPLDLCTLLDCQSIALRSGHMCAQVALKRLNLETALRVSFGVYNDYEDVEILLKSIKEQLPKLR